MRPVARATTACTPRPGRSGSWRGATGYTDTTFSDKFYDQHCDRFPANTYVRPFFRGACMTWGRCTPASAWLTGATARRDSRRVRGKRDKSYAGKNTFLYHYYRRGGQGLPPGLGCLDSPGAKERMKIRCESTKKGRGAKHCFSSCTGVCWRLEKI